MSSSTEQLIDMLHINSPFVPSYDSRVYYSPRFAKEPHFNSFWIEAATAWWYTVTQYPCLRQTELAPFLTSPMGRLNREIVSLRA